MCRITSAFRHPLFHTSSCQMLSQVTFAVNSVPEEEDVPPLSHRESSVQSWCVGVKRE